ncbi:MAG: replication initiation protein, partial [Rubrivivax sp.]|nr:replication initiation protein [Rubrivivax sp.]
MVDKGGNSVQFPNRPDNGYGDQVDFDAEGENSIHRIDFASLGELRYRLHLAAKSRGSELTLVVFQRELRPRLFQTAR